MKTVFDLLKKTLKYPVIWVGLIYLVWFILIPIDDSFVIGLKLLGVYLVVTVLEEILSKNKTSSIILLVVLLPVSWVYIVLGLGLFFSTVSWLGRAFIYTPLILLFSGYTAYRFFQRPSIENRALLFLHLVVIFPILATNMTYSVSYFPEVLDQKEFGKFKYYLVWKIDINYQDHLSFYRCEKWSIRCDQYNTYFPTSFDKIVIDREKNEVSAIASNMEIGLAFTYGDNSRSYEQYPVQLGDHVYQLSTYYDFGSCKTSNCDTYTYMLYECSLSYTSCDPLPIQYTATDYDYGWIYLEVHEATNEISAYNHDDNLIFTYGSHPVCYVDNCVILAL